MRHHRCQYGARPDVFIPQGCGGPPEAVSCCVRARRGSAVAVTAQLWATQIG